jgi:DNA mismatch repair protein MSH6
MQAYLEEMREALGGGRSVCYVSLNKDSHVLEVPEELARKVPDAFTACAGKKGVKRYVSAELTALTTRRADALAAIDSAQACILSRFAATTIADKRSVWLQVRASRGNPGCGNPARRRP